MLWDREGLLLPLGKRQAGLGRGDRMQNTAPFPTCLFISSRAKRQKRNNQHKVLRSAGHGSQPATAEFYPLSSPRDPGATHPVIVPERPLYTSKVALMIPISARSRPPVRGRRHSALDPGRPRSCLPSDAASKLICFLHCSGPSLLVFY